MKDKPDPREIKSCAECACFNLRKAARVITQLYDRLMQPEGLRGTQFSILVVLSLTGPQAVTELSEHLVMDRTTLTRNLRPLERQGIIKLTRGKDRRIRTVSLTSKGSKKLAKAFPLWERAQSRVIRKLGRKRFDSFIGDLSNITSLFSERNTGG
jgi:DNA-binding MarR family transcriptional regulator